MRGPREIPVSDGQAKPIKAPNAQGQGSVQDLPEIRAWNLLPSPCECRRTWADIVAQRPLHRGIGRHAAFWRTSLT